MAKDKNNQILQNLFSYLKKIQELVTTQTSRIDLKSNIQQRVISSLILIPIALYAIFYSKSLFMFLAIMIAILMTMEWSDITKTAKDQKKWRLIGVFYILIPIYSVIKIRLYDVDVLFWMFAVIWSTDIFAFFAGRTLGGPKLAPEISPNKTWSGLGGGIIASILIGWMSSFMFHGGAMFFVTMSAILALVEQASDLFESKIKRIFGVKDSGNIIPGHGGVLDRLDGMMFAAPLVLLLVTIFSDKF